MHKLVIIEDEPLARNKLKRLLQELPDETEIISELTSVTEVDAYLAKMPAVDLIFSDIELTDGNVFQSFQRYTPPCPVIFITAYDQFMLDAFETHGIGYLLKPYSLEKLLQVWQKFRQLTSSSSETLSQPALHQLQALLNQLPAQVKAPEYPSRLPIRQQQQIYFLTVSDLVYIQADGGLLLGYDITGKRHFLPFTSLQALMEILDPACFFRINRSELVQLKYIERLERYCKNTLLIHLKLGTVQLKTSQSRTAAFTAWLGV
ncbi:LytTR family DNA-binding domain-containing protein [Alkalimonas delamerensis]|uniref:LytTR family DNA-binding domain-containing protein n=1 Tax=Alkalimonas delamerensis TaxID=265981 RepID=A0ABT9GRE0_9GAMM|nr:LytTR family DNA-binding domain-containing protein [Alkalimonas delamerensis]MDP4529527.1 LytTR family DNA-binding domain-containing protein [Alkalimonas delamerensis]